MTQHRHRPGGMGDRLPHEPWGDFRWYTNVGLALPLASAALRHIRSDHERAVAGPFDSVEQVRSEGVVAGRVQLKPAHVAGQRADIFGRGGRNGAQDVRETVRPGSAGERLVRPWPDQSRHAERRDADRCGMLHAEQRRARVGFDHALHQLGNEFDIEQRRSIAVHRRLVAGAAGEVLPTEVGQSAFRPPFEVLDRREAIHEVGHQATMAPSTTNSWPVQ